MKESWAAAAAARREDDSGQVRGGSHVCQAGLPLQRGATGGAFAGHSGPGCHPLVLANLVKITLWNVRNPPVEESAQAGGIPESKIA